MTELAFLPAHELARLIRRKQVSAQELLAMYLGRISRLGGPVNAVVVLDAERATARARAADEALARGENWGPLHGVPMTVRGGLECMCREVSGKTEHEQPLRKAAARDTSALQASLCACKG